MSFLVALPRKACLHALNSHPGIGDRVLFRRAGETVSQVVSYEQLLAKVGTELGVSEWLTINQPQIDRFGELTGDLSPIHVDPAAAAETPLGGTIAHGFLTLSLVAGLAQSSLQQLDGLRYGLNYGLDKVRFLNPVPVGHRVRCRLRLAAVKEKGPGRVMVEYDAKIEIEGEAKPALAARWLTIQLT
jgi:acyl dehydratase